MNDLSNFISIPLFMTALAISIVCIVSPVKFVQALFLWPLIVKRLVNLKFPNDGDEMLAMIYKDPLIYAMKYKRQMETVRLMGFIGVLITVIVLCKLLN